jgi:hypothetical protein
LRKVIEWHRHDGAKVEHDSFVLQAEPVGDRKPIAAFERVLFARSDRVDAHDPTASASVVKAIGEASGHAPDQASDWAQWRSSVQRQSPLLLVILAHNETAPNRLPELSIGAGKTAAHRLILSSIRDDVLKGPATQPAPIVMLLGCETGAPDISYLGYVPKLRRYGAAIVMCTGATVLGRHIAPVSVELVRGLRAATAGGPAALGDVMLQLRRRMLAAGFPIVLSLTAVGDADWLIE